MLMFILWRSSTFWGFFLYHFDLFSFSIASSFDCCYCFWIFAAPFSSIKMFLRFFLITIKEKQFFHSMLLFFSVPRFFPALALVCLAACLLTVLTCLINCPPAWFLACLPIFENIFGSLYQRYLYIFGSLYLFNFFSFKLCIADTIFKIALIDTFLRIYGDRVASSVKILYLRILYRCIASKNRSWTDCIASSLGKYVCKDKNVAL